MSCEDQPTYAGIRRRSDYIIGFIAPAIGPNKSKKLTRLKAPAHNVRGNVSLNEKQPTWLHRQTVIVCEAMYVVFHSNFAAYIVCRCKEIQSPQDWAS